MKQIIMLDINNEFYEVAVEPNRTLLEVLRESLGMSGTKKACDEGECGACTVLIDGKPVSSCLTLAVEAQGRKITTIEGLAENGKLHPVQQAFLEHGAFQCGFCTAGMIMAAAGMLKENTRPTEEEARRAIAGNLCRCTGYTRIAEAIVKASEKTK